MHSFENEVPDRTRDAITSIMVAEMVIHVCFSNRAVVEDRWGREKKKRKEVENSQGVGGFPGMWCSINIRGLASAPCIMYGNVVDRGCVLGHTHTHTHRWNTHPNIPDLGP